jgi:hypothetical protein
MDYKKIISSERTRFAILQALSFIPDSWMTKLQYRIKMGFWPDFKCPQRYTEKLQLYKMFYRDPVMCSCVDKYEVREYVKSKGLVHILKTCYGCYDRAEEIDIHALPSKFVAKTIGGSGGKNVLIVRKKDLKAWPAQSSLLNRWSNTIAADFGREWAYNGIKTNRIIVEELLEDPNNADGSIDDFKFMCFNGKFKCLWIDKGRYSDHHRGFWDENLNFLEGVCSDHDTFSVPPQLPDNIKEMARVAEKLSEDFPYSRIDLYNIQGRIVFGEITFYPWSGYVKFTPDEFDYQLGSYFTTYKNV